MGSFLASEWHSNFRQDTNILGHLLGNRLVYDCAGIDDCKQDLKKVCRAIILNSTLVMMSFKQKSNIKHWAMNSFGSRATRGHWPRCRRISTAGEVAQCNKQPVGSPKHARSRMEKPY